MEKIKVLKRFHLIYVNNVSIEMGITDEVNNSQLIIQTFEKGESYKITGTTGVRQYYYLPSSLVNSAVEKGYIKNE